MLAVPAEPTAASPCGSPTRRPTRPAMPWPRRSARPRAAARRVSRGSAAGSAPRPPCTSSTVARCRGDGARAAGQVGPHGSEDMLSLVHGRDYVMTPARRDRRRQDRRPRRQRHRRAAGAYPSIGAILPMLTQMMSVGVYDIPKVHFEGVGVMTNNTTVGAYRGAGRPEATSSSSGSSTSPPISSASIRPRSAGATSWPRRRSH